MTKQQIVEALNSAEVNMRNMTIRMSVQFRDQLIRELTAEEPEIEGGGSNWWYVCPECHGHIKHRTRFCGSCGKEIIWK